MIYTNKSWLFENTIKIGNASKFVKKKTFRSKKETEGEGKKKRAGKKKENYISDALKTVGKFKYS